MDRPHNPITPQGMYIADPEAHQWADGRLYVYGSRDESQKYYCSHRYHVLSTADLLHWDVDEDSFASRGPASQVPYSDALLFAPDCAYRNGLYYLYYCLASGKDDEGVATSPSPYGPFTNGRVIKGINQIDPAVFVDDDGQAYIYWGQFQAKAAKLKPNMVEIEPGSIVENVITEKEHFFHEGSSIRKQNGIYYLVYAHIGRRGRPTCLGYATSSSPLGPFKYQGVIIDNHGCDPAVWNNHGSIAEFNGNWYVFYHRATHNCVMMRKACVEPIRFNEDGTIPEVLMTTQGVGGPINPLVRLDAATACQLSGNVRISTGLDLTTAPESIPTTPTTATREALREIRSNDTATFRYLDFSAPVRSFTAKILGPSTGGQIEIRLDSAVGPVIGICPIPATDNTPQGWSTHTCAVTAPTGTHALHLTFTGPKENLFTLDWITFGH